MSDGLTRRGFIGGAMAAAAATGSQAGAATGKLPARVLGRTGIRTPTVGIGCGMSWWGDSKTEERALEALETAVNLGITYVDTGQAYGEGKSEDWIGKILKSRREEIIIASKITVRDPDEALRETERCLERLQTNHLDVLHVHNLAGADDLARIEEKGGLIDVVQRLRDEKVTRFIGITSHTDPDVLSTALERHDFDCTQMALNAALQGFAGDRPSVPPNSFESTALEVARRKNIGVIAMKVTGRGTLLGSGPRKSDIDGLLRYALSLPIAVAVVGMSRLEDIRRNAELAQNFRPLSKSEMKEVSGRMASANKASLKRFFANHVDA